MKIIVSRITVLVLAGVLVLLPGCEIPRDVSRSPEYSRFVGKVVRLPWDHWVEYNPHSKHYVENHWILRDIYQDRIGFRGLANEVFLPKGHAIKVLKFKKVQTLGPELVRMVCETITPEGDRLTFAARYMMLPERKVTKSVVALGLAPEKFVVER
jgi:hypothetical protein